MGFERVINDIMSNHSSDVISYVIALRDMETEFSAISLKLGELLLEQFHEGTLEEDIPHSLQVLLNDKEAFINRFPPPTTFVSTKSTPRTTSLPSATSKPTTLSSTRSRTSSAPATATGSRRSLFSATCTVLRWTRLPGLELNRKEPAVPSDGWMNG